MALPRASGEYISGVDGFLDMAFQRTAQGQEILCPCKKCLNRNWYYRATVREHLIVYGFLEGYTEWVFHGEGLSMYFEGLPSHSNEGLDTLDVMDDMLQDMYRDIAVGENNLPRISEGPNTEAKKFYKLMEEGRQELYPGCKSFSRLSFIVRLYLFKCLHGLSNVAFGDLLDLLKEAFPDATIPGSFNEAKKTVRDLVLDYKKIHACPNDCMLFWDEHEEANNCHVCGASRWKLEDKFANDNAKSSTIPAKVLRYFPLTPRLQRLFMCEETATAMRWHAIDRPNDGNLRHPADAKAWKDFDNLHPEFAQDPRNVRLGLASDGFNPFSTMSISHSTWPVVLINYNLSPLVFMKSEYILLSMIIPGPKSPGKDIDIYMQPLIKELKHLWEIGVETYDATSKQTFLMRVALLWTISDFPAYAMLSGWSTKGMLACPYCNYGTCSKYLKHSRKICYMGHRRFLAQNHPWRHNKTSFDGTVEMRDAPIHLSSLDVAQKLSNYVNVFGKTQKKKPHDKNDPWRKKSIFF
ncbi:uncharacterized protein LOC120271636 [Dioscorea cayenensis subsp. rotundata]|uniref:Uncharacterized protein LOC120271636 n=1 Tax=Dioscorea cayennensis subsp. rotundata TaxID=55577 RepID=A0AB40C4G2_DIOCR|nr:uncharacterized protein LOC120271636 [Dioscorea cayenensis subsp. rotundata]